jgi:hypothetical protein
MIAIAKDDWGNEIKSDTHVFVGHDCGGFDVDGLVEKCGCREVQIQTCIGGMKEEAR